MKAYRVKCDAGTPEIMEFEVQEFGTCSVIINGRRVNIKNGPYVWCKTEREAIDQLFKYAGEKLLKAERRLEFAKKGLENVEQYVKNSQI